MSNPEIIISESETAPLLRNRLATEEEEPPQLDEPTVPRPKRETLRAIILIYAITLLCDFAGYFAYAPQLQIFEDIICRDHYTALGQWNAGEPLEPSRCKTPAVQAELALLNGWKDTLEIIPGIILTLPYGALADRIGRKPVLCMGMFGCLLADAWIKLVCWLSPAVPLRAVWFSTVFTVIGGGSLTVTSMMFVIVAQSVSSERRSIAFAQLQAAALVSEVVATPISAALMSVSPWLPFLIGLGLAFLGTSLGLWVPETLQRKVNEDTEAHVNSSATDDHSLPISLLDRLSDMSSGLVKSVKVLGKDVNVILILVVFLVSYLGKQAIMLILQYASKRYNWTIAEASYLLSMRGAVNLLVLLVLLPATSTYLEAGRGLSTKVRDKRLTQASILLLLLGFILIFFAFKPLIIVFGLVIFALGSGFAVPARSLVTELVDKEILGTVYSAISVVIAIGMLVAGPLLANTFRWGMGLGEFWLGLPFLVAGLLYIVAFVSVSSTKLHTN